MAVSKIAQRRKTIRQFRKQLRQKMKTSGFWKGLDATLRHPVTLLILGFALTAFVGNKLQTRQQELDKERTQVVAAEDAIEKIRQAIAEYTVRGRLITEDDIRHMNNGSEPLVGLHQALVSATTTVIAQMPTVIRAIDPLSLTKYEVKEIGLFGKLGEFLVETNDEWPDLKKIGVEVSPDRFLGELHADLKSSYMIDVQRCADLFLLPFELSLHERKQTLRPYYFNILRLELTKYKAAVPWETNMNCPVPKD
jgi:hypothetical protein